MWAKVSENVAARKQDAYLCKSAAFDGWSVCLCEAVVTPFRFHFP